MSKESERQEQMLATIEATTVECERMLIVNDEDKATTLEALRKDIELLQRRHREQADENGLGERILNRMARYQELETKLSDREELLVRCREQYTRALDFTPIDDQRRALPDDFKFVEDEDDWRIRNSLWKSVQDAWVQPEDRILPVDKPQSSTDYDQLPLEHIVFDQTLLSDDLVRKLELDLLPPGISEIEKQERKFAVKEALLEKLQGAKRLSEVLNGRPNGNSRLWVLDDGRIMSFQYKGGEFDDAEIKTVRVYDDLHKLRRSLIHMSEGYKNEKARLEVFANALSELAKSDDAEHIAATLEVLKADLRAAINPYKKQAEAVLSEALDSAGSEAESDPKHTCRLLLAAIQTLSQRIPEIYSISGYKSDDEKLTTEVLKKGGRTVRKAREGLLGIYKGFEKGDVSPKVLDQIQNLPDFSDVAVEPMKSIGDLINGEIVAIKAELIKANPDMDIAKKHAFLAFAITKVAAFETLFEEVILRTIRHPNDVDPDKLRSLLTNLHSLVSAREIQENMSTGLYEIYDPLEDTLRSAIRQFDRDVAHPPEGTAKLALNGRLRELLGQPNFANIRQDIGELELD